MRVSDVELDAQSFKLGWSQIEGRGYLGTQPYEYQNAVESRILLNPKRVQEHHEQDFTKAWRVYGRLIHLVHSGGIYTHIYTCTSTYQQCF